MTYNKHESAKENNIRAVSRTLSTEMVGRALVLVSKNIINKGV